MAEAQDLTLAEMVESNRRMREALTELVIYHDVPAEAQDPVVLPLLRAAFAALSYPEQTHG